tara:strand:+ start:35 stop:154 length:120 start_codon:yes stop_codon:yes gene_type:complete
MLFLDNPLFIKLLSEDFFRIKTYDELSIFKKLLAGKLWN